MFLFFIIFVLWIINKNINKSIIINPNNLIEVFNVDFEKKSVYFYLICFIIIQYNIIHTNTNIITVALTLQ